MVRSSPGAMTGNGCKAPGAASIRLGTPFGRDQSVDSAPWPRRCSEVQDGGRAGDRRARVTVASMVAASIAILVLTLVVAPAWAPAQVVAVTPGDIIATEMAAGRVVAVAPTGDLREIASGLQSPRGVAVLPDGSILVAETGANRIVGIGGRFGA